MTEPTAARDPRGFDEWWESYHYGNVPYYGEAHGIAEKAARAAWAARPAAAPEPALEKFRSALIDAAQSMETVARLLREEPDQVRGYLDSRTWAAREALRNVGGDE